MDFTIVVYASYLFFLSEFLLMLLKRSKNKEVKTKGDHKSLLLFWLTIPAAITLGFYVADTQEWNSISSLIAIMGLGIFIIGIVLRWLSIIQLKKGFTVDIAIGKKQALKTDGLYKKIRHPSYAGLLLICFGLAVSMNSIKSLIVISIPIFLAVAYRIKTEEEVLTEAFGNAYRAYKKKTHKIIPGIY